MPETPVADPVTPPVDPPVTPPVEPPVTPPAEPPVTPPVTPPAEPPVTPPAKVVPETYALDLPAENSPFDESDVAAFSAEAKSLGLSQDEAAAAWGARIAFAKGRAEGFLAELRADPEIGGAKLEENLSMAKKGLATVFPPGTAEGDFFNGLLDRTGLGNHKLAVRAFARIGRLVSEDPGGGLRSGGSQELSRAQKLYPNMNP